MSELSGRDYMVSAIRRRFSDRIPTTVIVGPYAARMAGYTVKEILKDAKKNAEAHVAFLDRFQPDSIIVYNDLHLEFEAIGGELEYVEDDISRPKGPILLEHADLAKLKPIDPAKSGRLPYQFEVSERVSSAIGKSATMGLSNSGPWNIAMQLRGTENLLIETATHPEFVHDLMKYTTEVVKTIGDALIKAGHAPSLGEASASCSLISPKIYAEFIKPYHTELVEHFMAQKSPMALHICGFIDPIMEDVIDTGVSFISLDAPSSLAKLVEISNGRIVIMGNVNTTLFAMGTDQEMDTAVDDCLAVAGQRSGYIISSGCEIPLSSTPDRIEHYLNYARSAGNKAMDNLREAKPDLF